MNKNIPIKNFHHVAFRCRDAEQTRWFYEDILGLKLAAAMSFDSLSGTNQKIEYMHIFFEMLDGNYIAFFDDPHNAEIDSFKDMNGFDSHVAVEVESMEHLIGGTWLAKLSDIARWHGQPGQQTATTRRERYMHIRYYNQ